MTWMQRLRAAPGKSYLLALGVFAVVVIAAVVLLGEYFSDRLRGASGQLDDLRSAQTTAQLDIAKLSATLTQAEQQLTDHGVKPPPPPSQIIGQAGPAGPAGAPGRGIVSTQLVSGHLIVAFSDGTASDVGQVAGRDGRSITSSLITAGHLVLSYSDGTSADIGQVVGPAGAAGAAGAAGRDGRGIASLTTSNGDLMVTYSDGTTADAGPLPPGPQGPAGPAGKDGQTCPAPYTLQPDKLNGHNVLVCEEPTPSPSPSPTPTNGLPLAILPSRQPTR